MMKVLIGALLLLVLPLAVQAAQLDDPLMEKMVINMSGDYSSTSGHQLHTSIGEMIVDQSDNEELVLQAGLFNEFVIPIPTATPTPFIPILIAFFLIIMCQDILMSYFVLNNKED